MRSVVAQTAQPARVARIAGLFFLLLVRCGGLAEGEVRVTAYGESFIEDGIPANQMADGWSVTFDRFVVTLANVVVGGVDIVVGAPIDLTVSSGGAGHPIASGRLPEGAHERPRFTVRDIDVQGVATKAGSNVNFSWRFDRSTDYTNCETTTLVRPEEAATFEITLHADHLFSDSLVSETPQILFEAIADADTDADGNVTPDELRAADIGGYDPGNADIDNLWDWLTAQSQTAGHVDGEGHCETSARN